MAIPGITYQDRTQNGVGEKKTVVDFDKATLNGAKATTFAIHGNKLKVDNLPPRARIEITVNDPRSANQKRTLEFINNSKAAITARLYFDEDGIYSQNPKKDISTPPLLDIKNQETASWNNNLAKGSGDSDLKELGITKENSELNIFQPASSDKLNKLSKALDRFINNNPIQASLGKSAKPKNTLFSKIDRFFSYISGDNKPIKSDPHTAQRDVTTLLLKALQATIQNEGVKLPKSLGTKSHLKSKLANLLQHISREGKIDNKSNKSLLILSKKILSHNQENFEPKIATQHSDNGQQSAPLATPTSKEESHSPSTNQEDSKTTTQPHQNSATTGKKAIDQERIGNRKDILKDLLASVEKLDKKKITHQALHNKINAFKNELKNDEGAKSLVKLRAQFFELNAEVTKNLTVNKKTTINDTLKIETARPGTHELNRHDQGRQQGIKSLTESAEKLQYQLTRLNKSPNKELAEKVQSFITKLKNDNTSEGLVKLKQAFFDLNAEIAKESKV